MPCGIQGYGGVIGVRTACTVSAYGGSTARTPSLEGITGSRRDLASQGQRNVVRFDLACRSARAAVGVIRYRISLGSVGLPDCIQCSRGIGSIITAGLIGGCGCGRACCPALKGIARSCRNGIGQSHVITVILGLGGRRTRTAVGIVTDGIFLDVVKIFNPEYTVGTITQLAILAFVILRNVFHSVCIRSVHIVIRITSQIARRIGILTDQGFKAQISGNTACISACQGITCNRSLRCRNRCIVILGRTKCRGMVGIIVSAGCIRFILNVMTDFEFDRIPFSHGDGNVQLIFTQISEQIVDVKLCFRTRTRAGRPTHLAILPNAFVGFKLYDIVTADIDAERVFFTGLGVDGYRSQERSARVIKIHVDLSVAFRGGICVISGKTACGIVVSRAGVYRKGRNRENGKRNQDKQYGQSDFKAFSFHACTS